MVTCSPQGPSLWSVRMGYAPARFGSCAHYWGLGQGMNGHSWVFHLAPFSSIPPHNHLIGVVEEKLSKGRKDQRRVVLSAEEGEKGARQKKKQQKPNSYTLTCVMYIFNSFLFFKKEKDIYHFPAYKMWYSWEGLMERNSPRKQGLRSRGKKTEKEENKGGIKNQKTWPFLPCMGKIKFIHFLLYF